MSLYTYERVLMGYLENLRQQLANKPLNLGGVLGYNGGTGGPPGSFIGKLPQSRVTFDLTEAEEWGYPLDASGIPSGVSLVTNLNRIRYRLAQLEAGGGITPSGGGDMYKSVYDPDHDNIVEYADLAYAVAWDNVTSKPASFTPSVHHTSHELSGSDIIKLDDLGTPDDNTDLDVSISRHGLTPKLPNDATKYLNGVGSWVTVSGGGTALTVKELDGTPNVSNVSTIQVSNGTLTDNGSGDVTITIGAGGGLNNKILFFNAGSTTITEYTADSTGLASALAAAGTGDTIHLPVGTVTTADFTLPAGVTLRGWGWESVLSVTSYLGMSVSTNSVLDNFTLEVAGDSGGGSVSAVNATLADQFDFCLIKNMYIHTNATDGSAGGIQLNTGRVNVYNTTFELESYLTDAYVIYNYSNGGNFYYCNGIGIVTAWYDTATSIEVFYSIVDGSPYIYP